jgi:hypothetical protein
MHQAAEEPRHVHGMPSQEPQHHYTQGDSLTQYNGWANYETWRVNLEMLDGMTVQDFGYDPRDLDQDDYDKMELVADALEIYVCEMVEQDAKGFALDLAHSFLAKVDWMEIAEHMVADAVEVTV